MMVRRGMLALLFGAVATLFESSSAFLLPMGPSRAVGRASVSREQHHQAPRQQLAAAGAGRRRGRAVGPLRMAAEAEAEAGRLEEEMQKIKPMKIKEIKEELDERGVGYQDLLEKAEFMQRLAEARVKGITKPPPEEATPAGEAQAAAAAAAGAGPAAEAAQQQQQQEEVKEKEKKEEPKVVDEAARMEKALEEIMKMKVSEMKKELDLLKVSHAGFFEKREFAEALAKARMEQPANRGAGAMDPNDDPSEYRTVKVTRMPKDGERAADRGAGPGPQQQRGGGPRGPGGMGGDPFSDIFNQAGGARGARGGAGGADPFSSIFNGGFAGAAGGPFGGAGGPFGGGGGGGMGGFDPSILQKVMSNPRAAAAFQRAQQNPRIMKAVQEMARNPAAAAKYINDPEIASVLKELQSVFR